MSEQPSNNFFAQALSLHQAGKLDEAKALYVAHLKTDPTHADSIHLLGLLAAQQNDFLTAIQQIEQAVTLNPHSTTYLNNLANAYKNSGDIAQAIATYQKALTIDPHYAEAHNNLGSLFHSQNQYQQALQSYHQAVINKPDYVQAHENLGMLFLQQNNFAAASKQFANVVTLVPHHFKAHYQLANCSLHLEQFERAKKHYLKAIELEPTHQDSLNNLGVIAIKQNQLQQAIDYFSQTLAINDENLEARNNIAALFIQNGRYENALTHYELLLQTDPKNSEAYYNCGVAQMCLGKLIDARQSFAKTIEQLPNHINALINLGIISLQEKKFDEAKQFLTTAITLDVNNASARHLLSALSQNEAPTRAPAEFVANLFDHYAVNFDRHLQHQLQYQLPVIFKSYFQKIAGHPTHQFDILDLGCGTGLCGAMFVDYKKRLDGVDTSSKMVNIAKAKNLYDDLFTEELHDFFKHCTRNYDVMLCADVLGYIGDLSEVFLQCREHLNKQGYWLFSIEISERYPYELQHSVRYAHAPSYIDKLIAQHSFTTVVKEKNIARYQEGKPVEVMVYVLQRD